MNEDTTLRDGLGRLGRQDWQVPENGARAAVRTARRRIVAGTGALAVVVAAMAVAVPAVLAPDPVAAPVPPAATAESPTPHPSATSPAPGPGPGPSEVAPSEQAPHVSLPAAEPPPVDGPVVEPDPIVYPDDVDPVQGGRYWAVFVTVTREPGDAGPAAAAADRLRGVGLSPSVGDVACSQGASSALGLDADRSYTATYVHFDSREDAQQFVDAYPEGVVGTAEVTAYCLD